MVVVWGLRMEDRMMDFHANFSLNSLQQFSHYQLTWKCHFELQNIEIGESGSCSAVIKINFVAYKVCFFYLNVGSYVS